MEIVIHDDVLIPLKLPRKEIIKREFGACKKRDSKTLHRKGTWGRFGVCP
ncbi:hypothetical protein VFC49_10635 [Thermococcus sp. SY098]|nr:hypothetical protein [Thermococcus sp. SY098]WRS52464.1 hypothetical protein VFC49_10635 [Thermococcus sp. SY098]